MVKIEEFIKANAPGSLYGEWAKKEECWSLVREQDFSLSLHSLSEDLTNSSGNRKRLTKEETEQAEINAIVERLKSVHPKTWDKIENWGRETGKLSAYQRDIANAIGKRTRSNKQLTEIERNHGEAILNMVAEEIPELFFDMDEFFLEDEKGKNNEPEISIELVQEIVQWDKHNKRLKPFEYRFMADLADGKKDMTARNKFIAGLNLKKVKKYGFKK